MTDKIKRDVKITQGAFQTSDHYSTRWGAVLSPHHEYSDCFTPGFWSIISHRVDRDSIIEVRTEDQRFFAELYVIDSNRQGLSVVELTHFDLQGEDVALADDADYEVKWKGPQWRYCVIRKSDDVMVQKHMKTKAEGHAWVQLQLAA